MKQGHDITSIARQLREHISAKSKANMPPPVQLSVYDGSRQFTDGYVWALDGDKRIQCTAPGPLDLTAATVATQIVIMALPPNPDEPCGAYFLIGGGISGATNSRAPALMTTGVTVVGGGGGGTGTVTSVGFTAAPSGIFDVSGSPITTSGTIALSMDNQSANTVLRGPTSGGAATPSFGALVAADIPDISGSYVPNSLYDANTILKADSDNTPIALVMGASTILARLASGGIVAATTAQIKTLLAIAVADITDFASTIAGYIAKSIFTAKGSLIGASASATPVELTIGSNNQILTADSTQASGLKWATGTITSLFQHFADAGSNSTSETDLYSDTTGGSALANNGDVILASYSGVTVSSATATRRWRLYFGGTLFFDSGAITTAAADTWYIDARVTRESSSVVRASAVLWINGVTITTYTGYTRITGLTLSGTNIIKITGTAAGAGAATNDIVAKEGIVLLPASAVQNGIYSEQSAPSTPTSGIIQLYADLAHNMRQISSLGMDDVLHHGDAAKHLIISNTTTETDLYNRTIKANSLGANGNFKFSMRGRFANGSASTRTYQIRVYLGATTLFDTTYTVTVANVSQIWELVGSVANFGATNSNLAEMKFSNGVISGGTAGVASTETIFFNTAAIDTTADATFKITVTMSSAASTISTRMIQADMLGSMFSS